jgi:simple sugar transport system permease protein
MNKKNLFRTQGFVNAASSVLAICVGLLFGLVILLVSNSKEALQGLAIILKGGFSGQAKGIGQTLYYATPIIMTGLSVGFAFKTGLFNIGASGQFIVGAFVAILIGVKLQLPESLAWAHWIIALLGAMIAGGLWALIPGLFKAYLNVNVVISCIMMNYIGMYGVNYLIKQNVYDSLKALSQNVAPSAVIPKWGLDKIFYNLTGNFKDTSTVNAGFIFAVVAAIIIYIVLNKTVFGYELKACGYNRFASKYAGINEKRSIVFSMVIAGMLSGLGGGLLYLCGANGRRIKVVDVLAPEGFNGIPVALLGLSNPIGIIFAALFVAHITMGGEFLQKLDYVPEVIDIIIAAIIYFSAFSLLLRTVIVKLLKGKHPENLSEAGAAVKEGK